MPIKRLTEDTVLKFTKLSPEEKEKRGILGRLYGKVADFTNGTRNGRLYSEQLWEKLFNSDLIKERFANGGIFGELCHPADREEVDMEKVACVMPEPPVKDKDGQLVAYIDLLDTPCGRIAYQLAKYGYKLGISSRGSGDLIEGPDGEEEVDPDTYSLTAFDLVEVPAVKSARLSFVESLDKTRYGKTLRQSLTESLEKASEEDRKLMKESLDTLGIKLNESTIVTKGDSLNDEKEFTVIDSGFDSLSNKKLYKIMDETGKERWIPESDAKFVIDKEFTPEPEVEEPVGEEPVFEPVMEEPVQEDLVNESSSQELADDYKKWQEANPDVDLEFLLDDYDGNLGAILYSESGYNKFVDWAMNEHSVKINPMESNDSFDDMLASEEPVGDLPEEEPAEELPEEEPAEEAEFEPEATESLNEEGVQLADMGQIPQVAINLDSEAVLTEAKKDTAFYVNETPYGFTEVVYKGRVITVDGDQITVDIGGDEAIMGSIEEAIEEIDKLDKDPYYHVEPWHDPSDVKVASLAALKKMLNESMFVKKDTGFKKVAESRGKEAALEDAKREKPEKIDESFINSLGEELQTKVEDEDRDYFEDQIEQLTNGVMTLAMEAKRAGANKLSQLLQNVLDEIGDEQETIDESAEDGSDIDVVTNESEAVANLKEALVRAKELNKDNLSLQEKLSASTAREIQLTEELAKYKKAVASLSKTAKDAKILKESLNSKDRKTKKLTEKLTTVSAEAENASKELATTKDDCKKLTEQVEQLNTNSKEMSEQLDKSKGLVEKYRKSYNALKESYVEVKAQSYGLSKDAALKKLGESYKISDVDKTLRELGSTKANMNKLPINLNESAKLNKEGMAVRMNRRIENPDDTSLDTLMSLLEKAQFVKNKRN